EIAIMRCEAESDAIDAHYAPKGGDGLEFGSEPDPAHAASRISTTGTLGASPAAKAAPETSSRSSAKRTGTSNRNPARTSASAAGGESKVITPPSSSDHASTGDPPTLTSRLSALGRVMRRV